MEYTLKRVRKVLVNFPSLIESVTGQSATSYKESIGGGGPGGKAAAQNKEEILCVIIDVKSGLGGLSTEDRRILFETYVINESPFNTPQLRTLVRLMNGGEHENTRGRRRTVSQVG